MVIILQAEPCINLQHAKTYSTIAAATLSAFQ